MSNDIAFTASTNRMASVPEAKARALVRMRSGCWSSRLFCCIGLQLIEELQDLFGKLRISVPATALAGVEPARSFVGCSDPELVADQVERYEAIQSIHSNATLTVHDAILPPLLELPKSEDRFQIARGLPDEDARLAPFDWIPPFRLLISPVRRSVSWSAPCKSAIESRGPAHDRRSHRNHNAFRSNLHGALPRRLKSRALWRVIEAFAPVPA